MVATETLRPARSFWITWVHSRCYRNSGLTLIHLGNEQWGRRKKCADRTWNGNWTRKSSGHITIMWNCWPAAGCDNGMLELCISSPFLPSGLLTLRRSKPDVRLQPAFSLCATTSILTICVRFLLQDLKEKSGLCVFEVLAIKSIYHDDIVLTEVAGSLGNSFTISLIILLQMSLPEGLFTTCQTVSLLMSLSDK